MSYLRIFQTKDSLEKAIARGEKISERNTIYIGFDSLYIGNLLWNYWDAKSTYYVSFEPCTWTTVGVYTSKEELIADCPYADYHPSGKLYCKGEEGPYNWVDALITVHRNSLRDIDYD